MNCLLQLVRQTPLAAACGYLLLAPQTWAAVPVAPAVHQPLIVQRTVDGMTLTLDAGSQLLAVKAPVGGEDDGSGRSGRAESVPMARLSVADYSSNAMVPTAVLAYKAKQFDDGLYAAVELAAQQGAGRFAGKAQLLRVIGEKLLPGGANSDVAGLLAAGVLGGSLPGPLPSPHAAPVQQRLGEFSQQPVASQPLGFYTWTPALQQLFRQDRMLQQPLHDAAAIRRIAAALNAAPGAADTYRAYLQLVEGLTNPLAGPDLRPWLRAPQPASVADNTAFLPPSRSPETELLKRLYPAGEPPFGWLARVKSLLPSAPPPTYALADDVARRVRDGRLNLTPTTRSGWYDRQMWALEPLAAPERAVEASHLRIDAEYRKLLLELFKGLLASQRETHIRQLEISVYPAAAFFQPERIVTLTPALRVEPTPTYYLRRALGYRFARSVLLNTFGEAGLAGIRRLTPSGPVKTGLADELAQMEQLFLGAYAASSQDLGLPANGDPAAPAALPQFLAWQKAIAADADLAGDQRMMVPLFHDKRSGKTKVLAMLGWDWRKLEVDYVRPPRAVGLPANVKLQFAAQHTHSAYPVTVEVYVRQLLNRAQFQALCDREKTPGAILQALADL